MADITSANGKVELLEPVELRKKCLPLFRGKRSGWCAHTGVGLDKQRGRARSTNEFFDPQSRVEVHIYNRAPNTGTPWAKGHIPPDPADLAGCKDCTGLLEGFSRFLCVMEIVAPQDHGENMGKDLRRKENSTTFERQSFKHREIGNVHGRGLGRLTINVLLARLV
jgi:hypothetical protein